MTGFGSFDNSTCERVLDLLEPGDLRLGQVVIKRVALSYLFIALVRHKIHLVTLFCACCVRTNVLLSRFVCFAVFLLRLFNLCRPMLHSFIFCDHITW